MFRAELQNNILLDYLFPRLAVFSIDPVRSKLLRNTECFNNSIIFYDYLTKSYKIIKVDLSKSYSLSFNSKFSSINLSKIGGKALEYLKETIIYPKIYYFDKKLINFIFYTQKESESITRRLLEMNSYFTSNFGLHSFEIDHITYSNDFKKILRAYSDDIPVNFSIRIPYSGPEIIFALKISIDNLENSELLINMNQSFSLTDIDFILPSLELSGNAILSFLKSINFHKIVPNSITGKCKKNICTVNISVSKYYKEFMKKILFIP